MAVPTDPDDLQEVSACYCFDKATSDRIKIYLLAQIAGLGDTDPSDLAEAAACYCYDHATMSRVMAYLLCQAANGVEFSACDDLSGATDPFLTVTPEFSGQSYFQTSTGAYWVSTGTTSADWVLCNYNTTGGGSPVGVATPLWIGQVYVDSVSGEIWQAQGPGLTDMDWTQLA